MLCVTLSISSCVPVHYLCVVLSIHLCSRQNGSDYKEISSQAAEYYLLPPFNILYKASLGFIAPHFTTIEVKLANCPGSIYCQ